MPTKIKKTRSRKKRNEEQNENVENLKSIETAQVITISEEITKSNENDIETRTINIKITKSKKEFKSEHSNLMTGTKNSAKQIRSVKTLSSVLNQSISHRHSLNTSTNRKITDYFQARKSTRKCKSDLEKEKRNQIEDAIKNCREEGLEIKNLEEKGRGVFSTKYFKKGDFVCEYAGEMISYQLAKKREEQYAQDPTIGCYMYFFEYKSKAYCIDATAETDRLGRLFNHSKTEGNCVTKLFEINSRPYLILVASRDIKPGEEMLYDYGERNKIAIESHPWLAK